MLAVLERFVRLSPNVRVILGVTLVYGATVILGWFQPNLRTASVPPSSDPWILPAWAPFDPAPDLNTLKSTLAWGPQTEVAAGPVVGVESKTQTWRVIGVLRQGDQNLAIFGSESGTAAQFRGIGEDAPLGGKIVAIGPTDVIIENVNGRETKFLFRLNEATNSALRGQK